MEFFDLVQQRFSVRAYQSTLVEQDKLDRILDAARLAPTAANRQPFQVIVTRVGGKEDQLQKVYHREWFTQAPLILCVCGIHDQAWVRGSDGFNGVYIDVAIVMTHILLAATDLGLGTCWIGAFKPDEARKFYGLPENIEPVALTPLGYPAESLHPKERKPLINLVRYDHW